jgi:ADP-ribose pyrophosphatase YjhB (NUDIX family)
MAEYHKVGLLVIHDGRMLLCRKKEGTSLLILPGGCFEPGESAEECLHREVQEELGPVSVAGLHWIGTYSDVAAGDPTKRVVVELYRGELIGEPEASSEIAELYWFGSDDDESLLAPSIRNHILPDLRLRGVLERTLIGQPYLTGCHSVQ